MAFDLLNGRMFIYTRLWAEKRGTTRNRNRFDQEHDHKPATSGHFDVVCFTPPSPTIRGDGAAYIFRRKGKHLDSNSIGMGGMVARKWPHRSGLVLALVVSYLADLREDLLVHLKHLKKTSEPTTF